MTYSRLFVRRAGRTAFRSEGLIEFASIELVIFCSFGPKDVGWLALTVDENALETPLCLLLSNAPAELCV